MKEEHPLKKKRKYRGFRRGWILDFRVLHLPQWEEGKTRETSEVNMS